MTWSDIVATGSGPIEFRLVIEGARYQFVTSHLMRGALADGRRRIVGLLRDGLGFSESAYLAGAELNITINSATIVETPEPDLNCATEIFSKLPRTLTWLSSTVAADAVLADVFSEADLTIGDFVHVATEVWKVTGITGTAIDIERAQWGTTAQRHGVSNTTTAATQQVTVTDGIEIWTKRRWWLYAHGPSELSTSDEGELVMQGVIGAEPEEANGEWTIQLESRWALLEQEVAAAADVPRKIRGIYYPGVAPLYLIVQRSADVNQSGATAGIDSVRLSGFWETQEEFCEALADAFNSHATIGTWATWSCAAVDGRWELYLQTPAVDPRFLRVSGPGSAVDGFPVADRLIVDDGTFSLTGYVGVSGVGTTAVSADSSYIVAWDVDSSLPIDDARRVPRTINRDGVTSTRWPGLAADVLAFPVWRQYLDSTIGLADGDVLLLPQPAPEGGGDAPPPRQLRVSSVSSGDGWVLASDLAVGAVIEGASQLAVAGPTAEAIEFSVARAYSPSEGFTLADFRDALIAAAPGGANDASTPWVLNGDLADWTDVIEEAANGLPYLTRRSYTFAKGQRLEDVIKQECRLYGVYPYLDAEFKIALRRMTVETAEIASGLHVRGASHVTDERRTETRAGSDGNVNVVEVSRGYDPTEDKYKERPIEVQSVAGVARAKVRRVLEIRPKTTAVPPSAEPTIEHATTLGSNVLSLFGPRFLHVVADVPWTFWDVRIGDSVLITDPTAPFDGARGLHDPGQGLASRRGIVVGREWNFDDAAGTLTLLITGLDVAGYTPSGRIVAATGATTSWLLELEPSRYAPSGSSDSEYFAIGDRIRLIEWDATSPTVRIGTIDSVNTNTHEIGVTLDASWTGLGGAIYNLCYAAHDDGALTAEQKRHAFAADAALRLDDGAGETRNARVFAP